MGAAQRDENLGRRRRLSLAGCGRQRNTRASVHGTDSARLLTRYLPAERRHGLCASLWVTRYTLLASPLFRHVANDRELEHVPAIGFHRRHDQPTNVGDDD